MAPLPPVEAECTEGAVLTGVDTGFFFGGGLVYMRALSNVCSRRATDANVVCRSALVGEVYAEVNHQVSM